MEYLEHANSEAEDEQHDVRPQAQNFGPGRLVRSRASYGSKNKTENVRRQKTGSDIQIESRGQRKESE